ncbi:MAG: hypothetical protein WCQ47_08340 [bacterium]
MKRFFKIVLVVITLSTASAYAGDFELLFGPRIDVKNYGTNFFTAGMAYGGKYIKLGINYSHASPANVSFNAFKPYIMIDIPLEFGNLVIAPTIDFGPEFGFMAGQKTIDVMTLGFGVKAQYYFTDLFGVGFTPVHFTDSFATYTTGGPGFTKQFRMSYDLFFSLLLKW